MLGWGHSLITGQEEKTFVQETPAEKKTQYEYIMHETVGSVSYCTCTGFIVIHLFAFTFSIFLNKPECTSINNRNA